MLAYAFANTTCLIVESIAEPGLQFTAPIRWIRWIRLHEAELCEGIRWETLELCAPLQSSKYRSCSFEQCEHVVFPTTAVPIFSDCFSRSRENDAGRKLWVVSEVAAVKVLQVCKLLSWSQGESAAMSLSGHGVSSLQSWACATQPGASQLSRESPSVSGAAASVPCKQNLKVRERKPLGITWLSSQWGILAKFLDADFDRILQQFIVTVLACWCRFRKDPKSFGPCYKMKGKHDKKTAVRMSHFTQLRWSSSSNC